MRILAAVFCFSSPFHRCPRKLYCSVAVYVYAPVTLQASMIGPYAMLCSPCHVRALPAWLTAASVAFSPICRPAYGLSLRRPPSGRVGSPSNWAGLAACQLTTTRGGGGRGVSLTRQPLDVTCRLPPPPHCRVDVPLLRSIRGYWQNG